MKKLVAGILTVILVVTIGTTTVFAAGAGRGNHCGYGRNSGGCTASQTGYCFRDADGDGICDYCGAAIAGDHYCRNYVDNDGDGICDRYLSGSGYHCENRGWCGR